MSLGSLWRRKTLPLVYAHRGASAEAPENSPAAFRLAEEQGADGIELDVMRCATGEVVVFHDDDLKRLAGRTELVRDLSLSDLRSVRIAGQAIPTLAEVLAEVGPALRVNIELKARDRKGLEYLSSLRNDGLALAVARVIDEACVLRGAALRQRLIVSSFDPTLLLRFRRVARDVATGLLFHGDLSRPLRHAWAARVLHPTALHPERKLVTANRVRRWHAEGRAVNVWTVDDPHEIAFLSSVGVDGIITNRPRETRAVLERMQRAEG